MAQLEIILESDNLKTTLKSKASRVAQELEATFEQQLAPVDDKCDAQTQQKILYDLGNINAVYCGLGCQLHGMSAAFLCAVEQRRPLSIINFQLTQYENYFEAIKGEKCLKPNETIGSKYWTIFYRFIFKKKFHSFSNKEFFDAFKRGQKLNDTKYSITFGDYCVENSQSCLSPATLGKLKELSFIKEPYAWLVGQTLKHFLKPTSHFERLLNQTLQRLSINFEYPIVG